ncbi:3-isopropylmalate dehydratase small subunit [Bradyrhizobium symbiodeficiens]|uniref:3-isopropylmalate dehydratase n=1 Tax=Bradyrhizobium symbiodeficiens TaxID=1404367 RepID=A0ABX5W678_9BRAD|nr:3-isopropylmalate dehydratase small subunit [Bradyrhizobium symbiodeficiens]
MQPFTRIQGIAAPLLRDNIDTDTIIRVERLFNAVPRADLGLYCMESLRHLPDGSPDPEFFQNDARYHGASILLCGRNFGCGSAREGAVWALAGMGIRCVIAPTVADLFAANCFQNGILAFTLEQTVIESLAAAVSTDPVNRQLVVDLQRFQVGPAGGKPTSFSIPPRRREALLEGFDEIDLTLKHRARIENYGSRDRKLRPWIYATDS